MLWFQRVTSRSRSSCVSVGDLAASRELWEKKATTLALFKLNMEDKQLFF